MSNVTMLADHAAIPLTTEQVLERAASANLAGVIVLGVTDDGTMFVETSIDDGPDAVWLIEKYKHRIFTFADGGG